MKKKINDEYHFVESAHIIRPKYNSKINNLKNKILKQIKKFRLNKMFLHIEFKINDKGDVEIIEINPRLAGGFIPILIKEATNLDLIDFYLEQITKNIDHKIKKKKIVKFYKIIFLIPPRSRKVKYIKFSNKIKNLVINKKLYFDKIKNFKNYNYDFTDRLGHLIFKSKNMQNLKILEQNIRSNVKFVYK